MQQQDEFEKAQDEWDKVAEIVPTLQHENECAGSREKPREQQIYRENPLVTIEEVLKDFRERYLERLIENEDEAFPLRDGHNNRFSRWRTFLKCPARFCQPSLCGMLQSEKTEILATSRCPFDDENSLHFGVLLTLYKQLVIHLIFWFLRSINLHQVAT